MADSELQMLYKSDRNPIQERRFQQLLKEQGLSSGDIGAGGNTANAADLAPGSPAYLSGLVRQQLKLQQEANAPAVASLEASIPETQTKFATQRTQLESAKEPLKQRYTNLLDELKRREGVETSTTTTNLAREYGKRGIPLSSGVYDQDTQAKTADISRFYGGQQKEVGLEQEETLTGYDNLIAQLTGQETDSVRAVRNAIAQLQAGGAQTGIQSALQLLGQQQQQSQFQAQQELAEKELDLRSREQSPQQYTTIGEGSTIYDLLNKTALYTAPKTYKEGGATSSGIDLSSIIKLLGGSSINNRYTPVP